MPFEEVESKKIDPDILGSVKATTVPLYKGKSSFADLKAAEIRVVIVASMQLLEHLISCPDQFLEVPQ